MVKRLIVAFFLIVLVTIGIFMWVTLRQTAQEVRNFMFRGGLTGTQDVIQALEEYYASHGSWEGVDAVLSSVSGSPGRGQGSQGMGRQSSQGGALPLPRLRVADQTGNLVAFTRNLDPNVQTDRLSTTELRQALPLRVNGDTIGYLLPEGNQAFTAANESFLVSRLNKAAVTAVLIAGAAAVALALLLTYTLLRPVRALTDAAARLATGDLSHRVKVTGKDELATLGLTFNHMAESLQQAEESRRALTADIAHELRNPLAVQRAHLEAIEDGVYPMLPESLTTIEEQNRLLTRLVDDLRTLALADSGQLNLETTATDFPALLQRVASRFDIQAAERDIHIRLNVAEACPTLLVDPQRIQQILHNLLSNALRYSPKGGSIWMEVACTSGQVILSVRDEGPGIPAEALAHIFDRFYRGDKARARTQGGTGLGLSIARKLAQAHGGDMSATNHPQGGAEFKLILPIAQ